MPRYMVTENYTVAVQLMVEADTPEAARERCGTVYLKTTVFESKAPGEETSLVYDIDKDYLGVTVFELDEDDNPTTEEPLIEEDV